MKASLRNEEYEVNASLLTEDEQWGITVCIRKNCSDISFG